MQINPRLPKAAPKVTQSQPAPSLEPSELPNMDDAFSKGYPDYNIIDKYLLHHQLPMKNAFSFNLEEYNAAKSAYYGDIEQEKNPKKKLEQIQSKIQQHKAHPLGYTYQIAKHLYSAIDRREDGTVRSIYNREPIKHETAKMLEPNTIPDYSSQQLVAMYSTTAPEMLGAYLAFNAQKPRLNCEHVVPRSWFGKKEPMLSDLHHLFACDKKDNGARGNTPYGRYQPKGGKGEVARATLYFMLRYPKVQLPYKESQITMLKEWAKQDPVSNFERRRNGLIEQIQGNRNPFIDYPELLDHFEP